MKNKKRALFPGSFDPLHNGHIDIIKRASKLFDEVYIAVSINVEKRQDNVLSRYVKAKSIINNLKIKNVKVILNKNLTIEMAEELKCDFIIRSIRNVEDLKYEIDMAQFNYACNKKIETVLIIADPILTEVSSTKIKDVRTKLLKINKK